MVVSANDLVVRGAEPLYFLATTVASCCKLDVAIAVEVVKGIAVGCKQAGCALIGGETAEMPRMYQQMSIAKEGNSSITNSLLPSTVTTTPTAVPCTGDYDLAGFAVGAVERAQLLPHDDIAQGDVLLGLPSTGLHSNGSPSCAQPSRAKAYPTPCHVRGTPTRR